MRAIRVLALLLSVPVVSNIHARVSYDLREAVVRFEYPHDRFVRQLFGCSARGMVNSTTCTPRRGIVSYRDYFEARKAAADLYDLKTE